LFVVTDKDVDREYHAKIESIKEEISQVYANHKPIDTTVPQKRANACYCGHYIYIPLFAYRTMQTNPDSDDGYTVWNCGCPVPLKSDKPKLPNEGARMLRDPLVQGGCAISVCFMVLANAIYCVCRDDGFDEQVTTFAAALREKKKLDALNKDLEAKLQEAVDGRAEAKRRVIANRYAVIQAERTKLMFKVLNEDTEMQDLKDFDDKVAVFKDLYKYNTAEEAVETIKGVIKEAKRAMEKLEKLGEKAGDTLPHNTDSKPVDGAGAPLLSQTKPQPAVNCVATTKVVVAAPVIHADKDAFVCD
jgi:hypothetical protein